MILQEELLANILSNDQTVLHLRHTEKKFNEFVSYKKYVSIGKDKDSDIVINDFDNNFLSYLETKPDVFVMGHILEMVDDPKKLITDNRNNADQTVIFEFKYDEIENLPTDWKRPWKNIGLAHFLYSQFDWVNEIYLDGVTVFTCKDPNIPGAEKKIDR